MCFTANYNASNSFIIKKETLNCLFNIIEQLPTLAAYFKKNLCVDF